MGLTNEHVGPKLLAKIKIYVLTRAELLFQVCSGLYQKAFRDSDPAMIKKQTRLY